MISARLLLFFFPLVSWPFGPKDKYKKEATETIFFLKKRGREVNLKLTCPVFKVF